MSTHNKFTDFLIRHNYILKVVVREDNVSCSFEDKRWEYQFKSNHLNDLFYLKTKYESGEEELFVSSSILRWYIFLDILKFCRTHKLSYHIIKYFDEKDEEGDFETLLNINQSETSKEKEEFLSKYLLLGMNQGDFSHEKEISEKGLLHSWNILKGLLL
jgi:hypothetical protein